MANWSTILAETKYDAQMKVEKINENIFIEIFFSMIYIPYY